MYGWDVDERCREEKDKDGTGLINWLALFVVAQGGFLAGSAKEADLAVKILVLLGIYLTLSLLTIVGIVRVLRMTVSDEDGACLRAYDRRTIQYGRYILSATLLITFLLAALAYFGVLPGMKIRQAYSKPDVPVVPRLVYDVAPANVPSPATTYDKDRAQMDKWVRWISESKQNDQNARLIWLEQVNPFDKPYGVFKAEVVVRNPQFQVAEGVCFLRSLTRPIPEDKENRFRPVYRQMPFDHQGDRESDVFEVTNPEPEEQLVLILLVRRAKGVQPSVAFPEQLDQYRFSVIKL